MVAAEGTPKVPNIKIRCSHFWTELRTSHRTQYSERSGITSLIITYVKVKITHPYVTCHDWHRGGSRRTALLMLNLGARWGWVINTTLRPLYPRERATVPIVQEAGWTSGPVCMDKEKRKYPAPPGFQPRTVQPVPSRYTEYTIPAPASNYRGGQVWSPRWAPSVIYASAKSVYHITGSLHIVPYCSRLSTHHTNQTKPNNPA
jgi:hypothetical protein